MFSANENILLRQYKKQIVLWVEQCIPEDILDLGTSVMSMQVSCQAPGCVPLETIILIVFPKSNIELLIGLKESAGGTYKTKILKPMSDIIQNDIYDVLPSQFINGQYTIEKKYIQIRDQMFSIITTSQSMIDDNNIESKKQIGIYIQQYIQDYIDRQYDIVLPTDIIGTSLSKLIISSSSQNEQQEQETQQQETQQQEAQQPQQPYQLQICDQIYGLITQSVIDDNDIESKKRLGQYLIKCIQDYIDRQYIVPDIGKPFN